MTKLKNILNRIQRTRKMRKQLKELRQRKVKPEPPPPPPPLRPRFICFQAESNMAMSYEEEPHVVRLYYAVKVVGPSDDARGNDQAGEFPEIRPIFVTECEYPLWFGLGSAIYTVGLCRSPAHSAGGSCRGRYFQYFSFAERNPEARSWIALPHPARLRCACAAASLNGRLYVFGTSNTRFGLVEVESSENGDEADDDDEDDDNGEEQWLEVFDPVRIRWAAVQQPSFPHSVSTESPMCAVGWPPHKILLSSLSTDHFPCKFGYNVTDNRWEQVYLQREGVSASVPDDALLVNDDTFYYVSGALGRLCAYEIDRGVCFVLALEDSLAAKAQEGALDLLHIDGDRFCFIWHEQHNPVHKLLHCMTFRVWKGVDTSAQEVLGGIHILGIETLSRKSFLVDNFIARGRPNWL
ncbi:UNVERIFIED_CONTAM: hypothetical protein Sradi_3268900 [Sesamum radiatum]|uniref:Uncharacterized protein n=1 Tax=Sesamum radiatum TaxID=300843 RepID=A0AAW2R0J7_SESRA